MRKVFVVLLIVLLSNIFFLPISQAEPYPFTPRELMEEMLNQMSQARSYRYWGVARKTEKEVLHTNSRLAMFLNDGSENGLRYKTDITGFVDATTSGTVKRFFSIHNTELINGNERKRAGYIDYISNGNAVYFYLNTTVPEMGETSTPFEGEWLRLDSASVGSFLPFEFDYVHRLSNSLSPPFMTEEQRVLFKVLEAYQVVQLTQLSDGELDGTHVFRLRFTLNKNQLLRFKNEARYITTGRYYSASELAALRQQLLRTPLPSGEIWIGKDDLLPRKISTHVHEKRPNMLGTYTSSKQFTLYFDSFNNLPVAIEPPVSSRDFIEVLNIAGDPQMKL